MTIAIGDKLGAHEITALLGKGGMGEVYRAHDSRLKREVALKVLPAEFAADPDRLLRFRREAEVLASLNHPSIGAIYDFQEADGIQFLVMELVQGETLSSRLQRGALPVDDALAIAIQICDALDAAHEKGIVHRDLKPANISLTADGRVKVLDFGLAKAMEPARVGGTMANSPTLSLTATHAGLILGTAAYMSPEQAKGFEVDRRSDIFSFGCVLFEMLTGRQAFQGDTVPDVLASVLVREADLTTLPPGLNPRLVELVQRCLHKNAKRRWQAAGDVREELEIVRTNPKTVALSAAVAQRPLWKRAAPLVGIGALCAAVAAVAAWTLKPNAPTTPAKFAIPLPDGQNFTRTRSHVSAISPDGSQIVYVANQQLYVRRIGELEAQPIPGSHQDVGSPFFSPDGRWIGFFSFGENAIKKIPVAGGTAVTLCTACANTLAYGVTWFGNTIVYSRNGREILKLPDAGGQPEVWIKAGADESLGAPEFLPGGKRLMLSALASGGTWDQADIIVLSESGERHRTNLTGRGARYVATGHVIYTTASTIYAAAFDAEGMRTTGDSVAVAEGVLRSQIDYGAANFDISDNGTLIYAVGSAAEVGDSLRVLAIADMTGATRPLRGLPPAAYASPRVSPDGRQVAIENVGDGSIAIYDLSGTSQPRPLTLEGTNANPVWSPDGTRLAFRSLRNGKVGLFIQRADGTTPAERLTTVSAGQEVPMAWSDDEQIVFVRDSRLWNFSLDTGRAEALPNETGSTQYNLALSRGSRWAAFAANEGRPSGFRVFVRQHPAGAKFMVSRELANSPVWSRDSMDLFYFRTESRRLVSVHVSPPPAFALSDPVVVPIQGLLQPEGGVRQFDIMNDGKLLVLQPAPEDGEAAARPTQQIHVVLNWADALPRLAPREQ